MKKTLSCFLDQLKELSLYLVQIDHKKLYDHFLLNNWKDFNNLDVQNLMDLNVHLSDPYFFHKNNAFEKRFLYLFENKYNSAADRFAYVGYQILLHL